MDGAYIVHPMYGECRVFPLNCEWRVFLWMLVTKEERLITCVCYWY